MARRIIAFVLAIPLVFAQSARAATEVNSCGQAFSGSAFLSADLDCTGFPTDAVVINNGGTLDLRGFTLTGGSASAVCCSEGCKITSDPPGGKIQNAGVSGVYDITPGPSSIRISDVAVSGNGGPQVATGGNVSVQDSLVSGTGSPSSNGVIGNRVRVVNSTINDTNLAVLGDNGTKLLDSQINNCVDRCVINPSGGVLIKRSAISGAGGAAVTGDDKTVRVVDSTITGGGGHGIEVSFLTPLRVTNSDITGNLGRGISSGGGNRLVVKDSLISGNGEEGVFHTNTATIKNTTISANGLSGISSDISSMSSCGPIRLVGSTVSGNGTNLAVCGVSETCADVATCAAPAILANGSTCETSYDTDSGFPGTSWGVCSLD